VVGRNLIVVGASAGGVDALKSLVENMPADLPAAVLIVLHLPSGSPSALPAILRRRCPLPTGALFEITQGDTVYSRCRVGHAWSEQVLLAQQSEALESALWTALRALEEKAALSERMAKGARDRCRNVIANLLSNTADESAEAAQLIREVLEDLPARAQPPSYNEVEMHELAQG
jgi:CheB methylesterase